MLVYALLNLHYVYIRLEQLSCINAKELGNIFFIGGCF